MREVGNTKELKQEEKSEMIPKIKSVIMRQMLLSLQLNLIENRIKVYLLE